MKIEQLPDFLNLQQLSRSLWRRHAEQRGAAVLVGAGFSLNADLAASDTPCPPIWNDLREKMAAALYPDNPSYAPMDSLRVAEEYRAYFGQSALDDFVRANIHDGSWYPSKFHTRLLELPWSDVLTTNWDTLLERAARKVIVPTYEVVRSRNDFAHARSPRIVKLHGTIGVAEKFTFAEEDYRTYPQQNAAFVNFARQVFIENELCLLGFSGDDPNFLQWSGWVRDQLASSSRRIYLVGVLKLSPAKRKLLEKRNVAPIDLSGLVDELPLPDQHSRATDALLNFLKGSRPAQSYEWKPQKDLVLSTQDYVPPEAASSNSTLSAAKLIKQSKKWRAERKSYPGWLVCPQQVRSELRWHCSEASDQLKVAGENLRAEEREEVLYELAWRFDVAMMPLTEILYDALSAIAENIESTTLGREQRRLILRVLLYTARDRNEEPAFSRWTQAMSVLAESDLEAQAELAYERCLRMKDQMDLLSLEQTVPAVQGPNPMWKVRQAYLLCELRRWPEARRLVTAAFAEFRDRESDSRNSLWIRSRRSWSQWLALASEPISFQMAAESGDEFSKDFSRETESKCNPWSEIESLRAEVRESHRQLLAQEAERFVPLFEVGSYRHDLNTIRFMNAATVSPDYTVRRLSETVGLPYQIGDFGLLHFEIDALGLTSNKDNNWYLNLSRYATDDKNPLIARYLGRIAVASLPASAALTLAVTLLKAINFWRERAHKLNSFHSAIEALSRLISMLYRLTPRMDAGLARQCFKVGIDVGSDPKLSHHWLIDPISNLLKHSALAMPASERSDELLSALNFPLGAELGANLAQRDRWPNPLDYLLNKSPPPSCTQIGGLERIRTLIKVATLPGYRAQAIDRLTTLAIAGALLPDEEVAFGEALWSQVDEGQNGLPRATTLYKYLFALLPAPPHINKIDKVRDNIFSNVPEAVSSFERLNEMAYAANYLKRPLLPTPDQAIAFFLGIVERYAKTDLVEPAIPLFGTRPDEIRRVVGFVLAMSVVPALNDTEKTEGRARLLLQLTNTNQIWSALGALPYFASHSEELSLLIVERISEGIMGPTFDEVSASAWAIEVWQTLCNKVPNTVVPIRLIEAAVGALEARRHTGLPNVVHCCRKLLPSIGEQAFFLRRVTRATISATVESDYAKLDPMEHRVISVSMVRAECCQLAKELLNYVDEPALKLLVEQAKIDPLPEVRFAAMDG